MKPETIVVIEDEEDILEVMEHNLQREGYRTLCSPNGEEGLRLVIENRPDLVLLDLMLPGLDGLEVCRRLKADDSTKEIPVVMVTAKGEESDIVLGLEMGADDYVAKPFGPKELIARIRAVLRRGPLRARPDEGSPIVRGEVRIDPERHEVRVEGQPVTFTATELRLLICLASNPGRVFTRDALLSQTVGADGFVIDRNVDVHVGAVRKKLGQHRELIETIRGVGYRFRDAE